MKWIDLFVRPPERQTEPQLDHGTHRDANETPILGESWLATRVHDLGRQAYLPY